MPAFSMLGNFRYIGYLRPGLARFRRGTAAPSSGRKLGGEHAVRMHAQLVAVVVADEIGGPGLRREYAVVEDLAAKFALHDYARPVWQRVVRSAGVLRGAIELLAILWHRLSFQRSSSRRSRIMSSTA